MWPCDVRKKKTREIEKISSIHSNNSVYYTRRWCWRLSISVLTWLCLNNFDSSTACCWSIYGVRFLHHHPPPLQLHTGIPRAAVTPPLGRLVLHFSERPDSFLRREFPRPNPHPDSQPPREAGRLGLPPPLLCFPFKPIRPNLPPPPLLLHLPPSSSRCHTIF